MAVEYRWKNTVLISTQPGRMEGTCTSRPGRVSGTQLMGFSFASKIAVNISKQLSPKRKATYVLLLQNTNAIKSPNIFMPDDMSLCN